MSKNAPEEEYLFLRSSRVNDIIKCECRAILKSNTLLLTSNYMILGKSVEESKIKGRSLFVIGCEWSDTNTNTNVGFLCHT